jgi:hypothetical protein
MAGKPLTKMPRHRRWAGISRLLTHHLAFAFRITSKPAYVDVQGSLASHNHNFQFPKRAVVHQPILLVSVAEVAVRRAC